MKNVCIAALALVVSGCAATYAAPTAPNQTATSKTSSTKAQVLVAARKALVSAGYQITSFDDAAGVISTAPRDLHVTPDQVNCGTTMGLDYLKDNRTTTRVAYGVIASDGQFEVRANIEGEYRPGAVDQNITLTCISRGTLDAAMAQQIRSFL